MCLCLCIVSAHVCLLCVGPGRLMWREVAADSVQWVRCVFITAVRCSWTLNCRLVERWWKSGEKVLWIQLSCISDARQFQSRQKNKEAGKAFTDLVCPAHAVLRGGLIRVSGNTCVWDWVFTPGVSALLLAGPVQHILYHHSPTCPADVSASLWTLNMTPPGSGPVRWSCGWNENV